VTWDDLQPDENGDESLGLAASFRPVPGGAAAYFEQAQAGVIRSLVSQIAELVSADSTAAEVAESGEGGDALEAQFRRYTEESLRTAKVAAAQTVLASLPSAGGDVRLSEMECQQWLRALNDVRLALSVRLGITDENEDLSEHLAADDPRSAYVWVYQWLAYLQDSLIEALT
jgi:hypothetical protein